MTPGESTQSAAAPEGAVVVGIDGSDESVAAFHVAREQARRRGVPLVVAHAWLVTAHGLLDGPAHLDAETKQHLADEVAERVTELLGGPPDGVEQRVVYGYAGRVLCTMSEQAELVVVGSRGVGALQGSLLGSVSQYVIEHASCAVMVVNELPAAGPTRVVVGVDGSEPARAALLWADAQAQRDGVPLVAVSAGAPTYSLPHLRQVLLLQDWEGPEAADATLLGWLQQALPAGRADAVQRRVDERPAAQALLDGLDAGDLVVVGRRGAGGLADPHLGSVSRRVASLAPGAVVIVHSDL